MINLFRKTHGAAMLMMTMILLLVSTIVILFAANYGSMQDKITGNQSRNSAAFQAAEAGMEFAINYFHQNSTAIVGTASGGYINYSNGSTTNVALADGSTFSVVYTNPTANDYTLIQITSTGTSADGTSTRIIRQQIKLGSVLTDYGDYAFTTKGAVNMSGNSIVYNTINNNTINAASTVNFSGNGQTQISTGLGTDSVTNGGDVTANQSSLQNMSQSDFFASYFGTTDTASIQSQMVHVYNNSSSTNYSDTLNGMTGTTIWINQTDSSTASLSGNTIIGSPTAPVLLIVNGSFSMSGNTTFYGFIFVIGTSGITTLTGNNNIYGGIATSDNLNMSGNSHITYDPTILSNLQNNSTMSYYAKVAGSWRDN